MTADPADTAFELLEYIDRSGGRVWLEGDSVRYCLPDSHATLERLKVGRDAVQDVLRSRKFKARHAPTLDPRASLLTSKIWAALYAAIPECLEVIHEDGHLVAWLEYRTPSKCWISTPPVTADQAALERLILTVATGNQDALNVAIKSARRLNPDINPAKQKVAQRARFSRKEISA